MVGDRYRDVDAGRAAGCVTILVAGPEEGPARPDHRAADLREAVATILTLTRGES
jgi:phosphoglycolate phosphatase-like HAD superfamily hydrolase